MKEIVIGEKSFNISCHASCYSKYRDIFDRNLMQDLQVVNNFILKQYQFAIDLTKQNPKASNQEIQNMVFEKTLNILDDFIDCITHLCWICIYDNDKQVSDYDTWYNTLERMSLEDNWIMEVVGLCSNCFRGRGSN